MTVTIIVFSASKVTTCSSVNQAYQGVVNSMLRHQGDNTLIIYQSCHAIVKQVDSQYKWLTLLQFYLRIWLSPSWILPSAAKAFPASVTKKIALIPSQPPSWLGMYVCTTDEMTVTFSSTIPVTPSLCKTIVVPYVDTNAKVTNFFPFCTIGIRM